MFFNNVEEVKGLSQEGSEAAAWAFVRSGRRRNGMDCVDALIRGERVEAAQTRALWCRALERIPSGESPQWGEPEVGGIRSWENPRWGWELVSGIIGSSE